MIRIAICVTIHNMIESQTEIPVSGAAATAFFILDKEDYCSIRYEEVLGRLMGTARANFNHREDEIDRIPG